MVDLHHHVVGFEIFKTGAFHCIPPWPLNHGKYPLISWENDMENFFPSLVLRYTKFSDRILDAWVPHG